jgi:hypothetical protein
MFSGWLGAASSAVLPRSAGPLLRNKQAGVLIFLLASRVTPEQSRDGRAGITSALWRGAGRFTFDQSFGAHPLETTRRSK